MKIKIIAGVVGACVAIAALVFFHLPILDILLMVFSALAAFELCGVVGMKNKPMMIAATAMAPLVVVLIGHDLLNATGIGLFPVLLGLGLLLVVLMLARFTKTTFVHLLYACVAAFLIPAAASTLILVRENFFWRYGFFNEQNLALFFVLLVLTCAWLTDTMALFTGKAFGKRKLCPNISPNKTWAGAIGGVVITTLINVGLAALFNAFFLQQFRITLTVVAILSLPLCVIAILGDLTASTLKRNLGVKDFGNLMPGHGGAMDRFDSFLFVAPAMLALVQILQSVGPLALHTIGA